MVTEEIEEQTCRTYTADCMGAILRWMHNDKGMPLYSDLIKKAAQPVETADQVKAKILKLLGAEGEKT